MLKAKNICSIDRGKKVFHALLMQLRKVCNHPYMFEDLEDEGAEEFGEHLVTNSSKMVFLDKLLTKLKGSGEKCILFSCFTTMLDILEDYCNMRGHQVSSLIMTDFNFSSADLMVRLIWSIERHKSTNL